MCRSPDGCLSQPCKQAPAGVVPATGTFCLPHASRVLLARPPGRALLLQSRGRRSFPPHPDDGRLVQAARQASHERERSSALTPGPADDEGVLGSDRADLAPLLPLCLADTATRLGREKAGRGKKRLHDCAENIPRYLEKVEREICCVRRVVERAMHQATLGERRTDTTEVLGC